MFKIENGKIEVRIIHSVSDQKLADMLNDGWSVIHMQFVVLGEDDDRLNVVLQRTVPLSKLIDGYDDEPPPQQ